MVAAVADTLVIIIDFCCATSQFYSRAFLLERVWSSEDSKYLRLGIRPTNLYLDNSELEIIAMLWHLLHSIGEKD